jgi:nucleoside-diphosphate-sugar epimerase
MKVVVTGSSGRIGQYVVREVAQAHSVIGFDRNVRDVTGIPQVAGDICDLDQCKRTFDGAEVILHLAAIPGPEGDGMDVMRINVIGTYAVHQAAVACGVRRVVSASTISIYGFAFRHRDFAPDYFPIDVAHPVKPQDHYAISKQATEEIAASFWRGHGLETIILRPSGAVLVEATMRRRRFEDVHPDERWGMWSYTDLRDLARMFRAAAEAQGIRHEIFNAVAEDNSVGLPSMELITRFWPGVPVRREIPGDDALYDWSDMRAKLGFEPKYTLRRLFG